MALFQKEGVTAGVEVITFHTPIQVGEIIKTTASIVYTVRSSMEIEVIVEAADVMKNSASGRQRVYHHGGRR